MWPWEKNTDMAEAFPILPVGVDESTLPWVPGQEQIQSAQPTAPAEPTPNVEGLASVVQPPLVQRSAPTTPAEFEQRKAGWMSVLDKVQNDPQARMIAMLIGARLMQGRKAGQSAMGGIADAIMLGASANQMMDYNAQQQELKQRELAMKEEESAARVGESKVRTEQTQQAMNFAAEKHPLELNKAEREAKISAINLRIKELEAIVADALARKDPDGVVRAQNALDKTKADLEHLKATTEQAEASAKANSALAEERAAETKLREILSNPKSTPEEITAAERALRAGHIKSGGDSSALVQTAQFYQEQWKLENPQNPGESPEAYAQRAARGTAEFMRNRKQESDQEKFLKFASTSGYDLSTQAGMRKAMAAWENVQKAFSGNTSAPAGTGSNGNAEGTPKRFKYEIGVGVVPK